MIIIKGPVLFLFKIKTISFTFLGSKNFQFPEDQLFRSRLTEDQLFRSRLTVYFKRRFFSLLTLNSGKFVSPLVFVIKGLLLIMILAGNWPL